MRGQLTANADQEVQFAISGPGLIAAVANADGRDIDSYQGAQRKLYRGRALVVIRTSKRGGAMPLAATAPGLSRSVVTIQAKPSPTGAE